MLGGIKTRTKGILGKIGLDLVRGPDPVHAFHSDHYLRHTARRLEHLASLRIPVAGMSVLEVGAGIGDHSHYYLDRGCGVTVTDARAENLAYLRKRYPNCSVRHLDMDSPAPIAGSPFDVVHCYGLLYHLSRPKEALAFLGRNARKMLFLESCVSFGEAEEIHLVGERQSDPTQAWSGTGCRPTRAWLFGELRGLFEYVYVPATQPCHEEFPLDWTAPEKHTAPLQRAIFIASRERLENEMLTASPASRQTRHA
ncbi:MAG: class I SAM-dependent methyltransferase [Burkholderiales bacterium]